MVTPLRGELRREIRIDGAPHIVILTGKGLRLVRKGHRKGQELEWKDLVSGDAALAASLNAALRGASQPRQRPAATSRRAARRGGLRGSRRR